MGLLGNFYPRPLRGGRRSQAGPAWYSRQDFYPRPLRGGRRRITPRLPPRLSNFYPRPLRGGRRSDSQQFQQCRVFLSTPSARRATAVHRSDHGQQPISIHALCEEGDEPHAGTDTNLQDFYPRPLRGGRPTDLSGWQSSMNFYPRPLRGGRPVLALSFPVVRNFYPRPLRGGRRIPTKVCKDADTISIHALCEEGDTTQA